MSEEPEENFEDGAGSFYDTEVIEVNGEKHTVRKRDKYTVGNDFAAASFWVSIMHR